MANYKIGIVGFGYWGPNFARLIQQHPETELTAICEVDLSKHIEIKKRFAETLVTDSPAHFFKHGLDAVVICSNAATHYNWLIQSITNNVHILCEKPLTSRYSQVLSLRKLAEGYERVIMVGHVFEYHSVVNYIKSRMQSGVSGKALYLQFQRSGLGPVRSDVDVSYDLATHDISILRYLTGKDVSWVQASGSAFLSPHTNDISFVTLCLEDGTMAQINVSWIDPIKQRSLKVVCDKEMLLFEDVNTHDKLKIYTTGVGYHISNGDFGSFQMAIRDGDVLIPNIEQHEPLSTEFNHFIDCIKNTLLPKTDLENALQVMKVLDAIDRSIKTNGKKIMLH